MEATKTNKTYFQAVGRRKTSVARVRLTPAPKNSLTINEKDLNTYFPTTDLQKIAMDALTVAKAADNFKITAIIKGGGIHSQAEALRHGIARALLVYNVDLRKVVKKEGYLKRDPRAKERRKFGLKKARKAPAWSKR